MNQNPHSEQLGPTPDENLVASYARMNRGFISTTPAPPCVAVAARRLMSRDEQKAREFQQEYLCSPTRPEPAPKAGDILTHIASGLTHRVTAVGEDRGDGRHVCLLGEKLKLIFPQDGWKIDRAPVELTPAELEEFSASPHGYDTLPAKLVYGTGIANEDMEKGAAVHVTRSCPNADYLSKA